jgi:hypothetical protein
MAAALPQKAVACTTTSLGFFEPREDSADGFRETASERRRKRICGEDALPILYDRW